MIRRYGPSPQAGKTYRLRAGVYAVLLRDSKLLVTHQSAPTPEFQLPGGGIDRGESPLRALHREVFEETGWLLAAPVRLGAFRRFTFMPEYDMWAEKLCTIYRAYPTRRLGPPTEPGHRSVWLHPTEAANLLGNEGDSSFLRRALHRTGQ